MLSIRDPSYLDKLKVHKQLRCSYLERLWIEDVIRRVQELHHIKNLVFCDTNQLEFINHCHNELTLDVVWFLDDHLIFV